jgi:hypothetical protein
MKLAIHESIMQSIKAHLGHKEQYPNIGARCFDFNMKSMFFENSLKIGQEIHISLHLVHLNSS